MSEVVLAGVLHPVDFFLEAALFVLVSQVVGVNAFFTGPLQASDERVFLFRRFSGISKGKFTSSWLVRSISAWVRAVDEFHRLPAVGSPDVHALDRDSACQPVQRLPR